MQLKMPKHMSITVTIMTMGERKDKITMITITMIPTSRTIRRIIINMTNITRAILTRKKNITLMRIDKNMTIINIEN